MNKESLEKLLLSLRDGLIDIPDAMDALRDLPFEDMGFAKIDHHRSLRCGSPEVIFSESKTPEQVADIFERLVATGAGVLATRADQNHYEAVSAKVPNAKYNELARTISLRSEAESKPIGHVAIVAAGTSDLSVAEEARETAGIMGAAVTCHYDVGVAGIHRLLARSAEIRKAHAVVAVAGMEGALASVVGGLVEAPVIAVPTSVGYGASFGGVSALLTMLNSCASGVSVVNIDNGYGAGHIAAIINRQSVKAGA